MAGINYKMLARAQYDPLTENKQYRAEKAKLRGWMADQAAAAVAPKGSVAAQQDPMRYGSLARREYPGLFTPEVDNSGSFVSSDGGPGVSSGGGSASGPTLSGPAPGMSDGGLGGGLTRRNAGAGQFNLEDLDDDEFLAGLGLNTSGLRRTGGV